MNETVETVATATAHVQATTQPRSERPVKKILTDHAIKALKPAPKGKSYIQWDGGQPNFGVRVTDKGYRSFLVVRPQAGTRKLVWKSLGEYGQDPPKITLAEARKKAQEVLRLLVAGKHPGDIEAERRREAERKRRDTVTMAIEQFIKDKEGDGLRTFRGVVAALRRDFLGQRIKLTRVKRNGWPSWLTEWINGPEPIWRNRPVAEITRGDVVARLDAIKAERGKHAARHALSAVRRFFNWIVDGERYGVTVSPVERVRDKSLGITGRDLKRNRVLTDAELFDVWWAAKVMAYPFGSLVQLLMLNGQRRNDIAEATTKEGEIDLIDKLLTIPAERYKSGVVHKVPLSPLAVQIIEKLPKVVKATYIFSTTFGKRPISGFGKMKRKLDSLITEWREVEGREPMPAWTLHDIRRTVRTRLMSDCEADAFIAERILGHALPGLHGVYDQGSHRTQKRDALERWAVRLAQIVGLTPTPEGAVVVFADEKKRRKEGDRS